MAIRTRVWGIEGGQNRLIGDDDDWFPPLYSH